MLVVYARNGSRSGHLVAAQGGTSVLLRPPSLIGAPSTSHCRASAFVPIASAAAPQQLKDAVADLGEHCLAAVLAEHQLPVPTLRQYAGAHARCDLFPRPQASIFAHPALRTFVIELFEQIAQQSDFNTSHGPHLPKVCTLEATTCVLAHLAIRICSD